MTQKGVYQSASQLIKEKKRQQWLAIEMPPDAAYKPVLP